LQVQASSGGGLAGWHGGKLRGQGDKVTWGQGEMQRGRDQKIQGGVGQDRREFKSVNYNYLNQL